MWPKRLVVHKVCKVLWRLFSLSNRAPSSILQLYYKDLLFKFIVRNLIITNGFFLLPIGSRYHMTIGSF
jgi:hypothetical protein